MSDDSNKYVEIPGHTYDGISELDNPMPDWWLWTFLFTIIFAGLYYIHYEVSGGPTLKDELAIEMKLLDAKKATAPKEDDTEESLAAIVASDEVLGSAKATYNNYCASCHGNDLQGLVGPNLTDNYWIHGKGSRLDMLKVIKAGVLDKGMPTWEPILKKEQIYALTVFIHSKKGSNPANPKAPQGELVGP